MHEDCNCKYCRDAGWRVDPVTNLVYPCKKCDLYANSCLGHCAPKRLQDAKLENFDYSAAPGMEGVINKYLKANPLPHLFLHGIPGNGKSFMAVSLLRELVVNRGLKVHMYCMVNLLNKLKISYSSTSRRNAPATMMELVENIDVLCLDDVGTEHLTDWSEEVIYLLVNKMYDRKKPIITTSNFTPTELAERMNMRIVSRIVNNGYVVKVKGRDRRLQPQVVYT